MGGDIKSALDPNCMQTQRLLVFDSGILTCDASGNAQVTSSSRIYGKVVGVEVDTGNLPQNAVISAYDTGSLLSSPDYFLSYTVPASPTKVFFTPGKKMTANTGVALTDNFYAPYIVAGAIRVSIATGASGKTARVRIFVEI